MADRADRGDGCGRGRRHDPGQAAGANPAGTARVHEESVYGLLRREYDLAVCGC